MQPKIPVNSVRKSKQNRIMILSNCATWGKKKKLAFIKNQKLHI